MMWDEDLVGSLFILGRVSWAFILPKRLFICLYTCICTYTSYIQMCEYLFLCLCIKHQEFMLKLPILSQPMRFFPTVLHSIWEHWLSTSAIYLLISLNSIVHRRSFENCCTNTTVKNEVDFETHLPFSMCASQIKKEGKQASKQLPIYLNISAEGCYWHFSLHEQVGQSSGAPPPYSP